MILEISTLHLLVLPIHGYSQTTEAKERAKMKERARTQARAKTRAKIFRIKVDLTRRGNPVLVIGIKDDGNRLRVQAGIRDGVVRVARGRATRAVTNGK